MAKINLPRFMRPSRGVGRVDAWRWEIGGRDREALVAAGFASCDLKNAAGDFLPYAEARALAETLNARVDQWRAGARVEGVAHSLGVLPPAGNPAGVLTVAGLFDAYQSSEAWAAHPAATKKAYTAGLGAIAAFIGAMRAHAVTPAIALKVHSNLLDFGFWRAQQMAARDAVKAQHSRRAAARIAPRYPSHADFFALSDDVRFGRDAGSIRNLRLAAIEDSAERGGGAAPGHSAAYQYLVHARTAWAWAARAIDGAPKANPFTGLGLKSPEGRVRRITDDELAIITQASIDIGMPELGEAFALGILTAQRRGDLCAMGWDARTTGRVRLVQQKTGVTVDFRAPAALTALLERIWKRHRAAGFARMDRLLLDRNGNPYDDPDRLTAALPKLRARCVEIQRTVTNNITLDDIVLHDSRDTAVIIRLEAGMDIARVAEHTGHSLRSLDMIKRAYFGRNTILADQATDMLDAHIGAGGAG